MDTNVFIVYTEASVDSTGHIKVSINKKKSAKGDSMNLPSGMKTATEIIDNLRGKVFYNQGNRLTKFML